MRLILIAVALLTAFHAGRVYESDTDLIGWRVKVFTTTEEGHIVKDFEPVLFCIPRVGEICHVGDIK